MLGHKANFQTIVVSGCKIESNVLSSRKHVSGTINIVVNVKPVTNRNPELDVVYFSKTI